MKTNYFDSKSFYMILLSFLRYLFITITDLFLLNDLELLNLLIFLFNPFNIFGKLIYQQSIYQLYQEWILISNCRIFLFKLLESILI